jgi:NAD(P)-dependent dehydrogenase (short-subunit alcohol dehydrogenase family)
MNTPQKVAIVTGASQGIGAEIVKTYRKLGYRVLATSRSIKPSDDADVVTVAGDIGERSTAQRVVEQPCKLRPCRYAGQQRRHLHRQAL